MESIIKQVYEVQKEGHRIGDLVNEVTKDLQIDLSEEDSKAQGICEWKQFVEEKC